MSIKNKHKDKNDTLVMGMEVGHLLEDAEEWWDKQGSEMLRRRQFSDDTKEQQLALDATNPTHPNYIGGHSGIMLGYKWSMLTPDEKYRVVKAFTVTLKRILDGEAD